MRLLVAVGVLVRGTDAAAGDGMNALMKQAARAAAFAKYVKQWGIASSRRNLSMVVAGRAIAVPPQSGGKVMQRHGQRERTRRLRQMGRLA